MKIKASQLRQIIKEEIIKEGPSMDAKGYIANAKRLSSAAAFNDLLSIADGSADDDLKSIMAPELARKIIIDAAKILEISELDAVTKAIVDELGGV